MRFEYNGQHYTIGFRHFNEHGTSPRQRLVSILAGFKADVTAGDVSPDGIVDEIAHKIERHFHLKPRQSAPVRFTRCIISTVDISQRPFNVVPFVIGESKVHPNDNYCKSTGRNYSLVRAMEQIGDPKLKDEIRKAYFERHKRSKKAGK